MSFIVIVLKNKHANDDAWKVKRGCTKKYRDGCNDHPLNICRKVMSNIENMFSNYPDIVNVKDIQSMLGICKETAYKLVRSNSIRTVKAGKKYIIPKQAVINYLCPPSEHDIIADVHNGLVITKGGYSNS